MPSSTPHRPPLFRRLLILAPRSVSVAWLSLIAVILFLVIWSRFDDSKPTPVILGKMSLDEFKGKFENSLWPTPPSGATNICYAHNSWFHGFVTLFRFDAPADDCRVYALELLRDRDKWPKLTPIQSPPQPLAPAILRSARLESVDWFDIDKIQSGFEVHTEPSRWQRESVWIDSGRGRFYYFSSD